MIWSCGAVGTFAVTKAETTTFPSVIDDCDPWRIHLALSSEYQWLGSCIELQAQIKGKASSQAPGV